MDDENTLNNKLITAAKSGDVPTLTSLLSSGADPSFFDSTGQTPLMHAAANGHAPAVQLLLSSGAPWNALSPSLLSAGDLAMQNNHHESFQALLDHALRSELLLHNIARKNRNKNNNNHPPANVNDHTPLGEDNKKYNTNILGEGNEIVDGENNKHNNGVSTDDRSGYLEGRVCFGEDKVLDGESKAVMMAWERPLMEAHARAVCGEGGVRVLNVGFGMGLVDEAIERYGVGEHTIVEAHPGVWERMVKDGWGERENVRIVFGRWQDVIEQLDSYDGIFFDTYGEYYEDMREFHQHLPRLLKPGGIYSYFNGLCGDNAFFHVVYCQLVALELGKLGYSTQFIPLPVKDCLPDEVWKGVQRKYWQLDTYYLPVCQSAEDSD